MKGKKAFPKGYFLLKNSQRQILINADNIHGFSYLVTPIVINYTSINCWYYNINIDEKCYTTRRDLLQTSRVLHHSPGSI